MVIPEDPPEVNWGSEEWWDDPRIKDLLDENTKIYERLYKATDFCVAVIPAFSDLPWGGKSNSDIQIRIEQRKNDNGDIRWAVIGNIEGSDKFGRCLGIDGKWEIENKSVNNYTEFIELLNNFRFNNLDAAFEAAENLIKSLEEGERDAIFD